MKFVRVKSYLNDKLVAEQLYLGDNHSNALQRFRNYYPEHDQCTLVAETIDNTDPRYAEYISVAIRCGCFN